MREGRTHRSNKKRKPTSQVKVNLGFIKLYASATIQCVGRTRQWKNGRYHPSSSLLKLSNQDSGRFQYYCSPSGRDSCGSDGVGRRDPQTKAGRWNAHHVFVNCFFTGQSAT